MVEESERRARMVLACVTEPGDPRLRTLLADYTPGEVLESVRRTRAVSAWSRRLAAFDPARVLALAERHRLRFVVPGDDEWPEALHDLDRADPVQDSGGAPLGLWLRGRDRLADVVPRAVAIVGSRASTAYGERVAIDLAAGVAAHGITVVSGGAYGIDAAAHRGALAQHGRTIAVLAGGLDDYYPRGNATLLGEVAERGLLVSEAAPGEHPTRRRFLTRNRLIAAMSAGTVIVEAGVRSGARNTVTWATSCGRVVMAVPGPVGNATSFTPHRLIREGEAVLVTTDAEVREMIAPAGEAMVVKPARRRLLDELGHEEKAIYEALPARGERDTGELALRAGLTVPAALPALEGLRARGLVVPAKGGGWALGAVQDRPVGAAKHEHGRPHGERHDSDQPALARGDESG